MPPLFFRTLHTALHSLAYEQGSVLKKCEMLSEVEASCEFGRNLKSDLPRSVAGHSLEFPGELSLVTVSVIKFLSQNVKRWIAKPFTIEFLKTQDSGQHFRGQTDVLVEQ